MTLPTHYRLTTAQLAIWFAQRLDPESPAYNIGEYTEIAGSIDPEPFRTAMRDVLEQTDAE